MAPSVPQRARAAEAPARSVTDPDGVGNPQVRGGVSSFPNAAREQVPERQKGDPSPQQNAPLPTGRPTPATSPPPAAASKPQRRTSSSVRSSGRVSPRPTLEGQ